MIKVTFEEVVALRNDHSAIEAALDLYEGGKVTREEALILMVKSLLLERNVYFELFQKK